MYDKPVYLNQHEVAKLTFRQFKSFQNMCNTCYSGAECNFVVHQFYITPLVVTISPAICNLEMVSVVIKLNCNV